MDLSATVKRYSAQIGNDPLLIQAAGGNVSWKEEGTLWIKSSGTWLKDAIKKEIFIPLDLAKTHFLIAAGEAKFDTATTIETELRPSIETSLHALLPHKIVVHVHAVEVIARAVMQDAKNDFACLLKDLNWLWVDYVKPGPNLAQAIHKATDGNNLPDILILGNHGLVVGGNNIEEVNSLLETVIKRCQIIPRHITQINIEDLDKDKKWQSQGYIIPEDQRLHALALDDTCLEIARNAWVMYPDHAVFLGSKACFSNKLIFNSSSKPACILVPGKGVLINAEISQSQYAMLQCYLEVALRIVEPHKISPLTDDQINELLNWEQEKHRQAMSI
ncbi:MAG TPA: class II aldolase/adducin family protein [Gammaproteobacteria bacterium]|nr:class II aldolase/adducin family protein [Gammaproteobacteria bacterium]